MDKKKSFWTENFFGFALKNILIALAIVVALSWGAFILISIYTNHGKTEQVPNLKGLTVDEAAMLLNNHHLKMEVIDSLYTKDVKLGAIIDQNPIPKSTVKPGRVIYLVVNSKSVRQVSVPAVVDVSLRQAEAMLSSVGLAIENVSYAPSDYKDLVLDVQYRGKSVGVGTKLAEGSKVTLVTGNGFGGQKSSVPELRGLDLNSAKTTITTNAYTPGGVIFDEETAGDENDFYVYKQRPTAGDSVPTGARVDIWLSKDRKKKDDSAAIKATEKEKNKQQQKEKSKDIEDFF